MEEDKTALARGEPVEEVGSSSGNSADGPHEVGPPLDEVAPDMTGFESGSGFSQSDTQNDYGRYGGTGNFLSEEGDAICD